MSVAFVEIGAVRWTNLDDRHLPVYLNQNVDDTVVHDLVLVHCYRMEYFDYSSVDVDCDLHWDFHIMVDLVAMVDDEIVGSVHGSDMGHGDAVADTLVLAVEDDDHVVVHDEVHIDDWLAFVHVDHTVYWSVMALYFPSFDIVPDMEWLDHIELNNQENC